MSGHWIVEYRCDCADCGDTAWSRDASTPRAWLWLAKMQALGVRRILRHDGHNARVRIVTTCCGKEER